MPNPCYISIYKLFGLHCMINYVSTNYKYCIIKIYIYREREKQFRLRVLKYCRHKHHRIHPYVLVRCMQPILRTLYAHVCILKYWFRKHYHSRLKQFIGTPAILQQLVKRKAVESQTIAQMALGKLVVYIFFPMSFRRLSDAGTLVNPQIVGVLRFQGDPFRRLSDGFPQMLSDII